VSGAVRWEAVVRRLASEGVRTYVEVGPGTVLTGLVRKIDRDARAVSVEDEQHLPAVGDLFASR
jgi:[acyl-carrier-protein] S-malonyltransferase